MGPWIIILDGPMEFSFEGDTYVFPEGRHEIPFEEEDACRASRFRAAALGSLPPSDPRAAFDLTNGEFQDYVEAHCDASAQPSPESLPAVPPDSEYPGQTGEDNALPDEETPNTMGLPTPTPLVGVDSATRTPGEIGENPAREYFDARDPLPLYDIDQALLDRGTDDEEIPHMRQSIMHNEALPGRPHHDFGRDDRDDPHTVTDPVDIFKGQFILTISDINIPSRGMPLELRRIYRSGPVYFGPWGYNWDHNYNVYLRKLDDGGVAVWTGRLNEHVYKLNPDGTFEPPPGVFLHLERQSTDPSGGEHYVITDNSGVQKILSYPEGWPVAEKIPLVRIVDRHGNTHTLQYDTQGRLSSVEDHAGRYIRFVYGNRQLVERIADHTGRVWVFSYDPELEHLVQVTTPSTAEYPDGFGIRYEYDRYRAHPALRNNLIKIIDPAGCVVVENRYGDEPNSDNFCRVIQQVFDRFEATFKATRLQWVPSIPEAINIPALRVEVVDPGIYFIYTFNYRGDLLDKRYRLTLDGSYRIAGRTYRYDRHGNIIAQTEPNGMQMLYTYDDENADPLARGNLCTITQRAPLSRPSPSRRIAQFTYEPRHQRLKTMKDEANAVTTFVYDYEETSIDNGDIIRIEGPTATLPDGGIQERSERFTYNEFGQLIARRSGEGHEFTYEYYESDDDPAAGYLKRIVAGPGVEDVVKELSYDQYGNVTAVRRAGDSVTEFEYNALGQLLRLRQPAVNGSRAETVYHYGRDGRLRAQDTPRGAYKDDVIADPYIRHEFDFNSLGHLRSIIYGVNTARPKQWHFKRNAEGLPLEIVDPLGRKTCIKYDERSLPLKRTEFAETPQERTTRFTYERNGALCRVIDPLGRETEYRYDSWDRPIEVKLPGAEAARTRIMYQYGIRNQLDRFETIGITDPDGPPGVLREIAFHYDEAGRMVRRRNGAICTDLWYDRDSRLIRAIDQRGGAVSLSYDALGHIRNITDSFGNSIQYSFDRRGNASSMDEYDRIPGRADPERYHTEIGRDARDRTVSMTDPLGNRHAIEHDDRDLMIATTSPLGNRSEYEYDIDGRCTLLRSFVDSSAPVENRWQFDPGGRLEVYTDPEGRQTHYSYEADDRWSRMAIPDSGNFLRTFNVAGEIISEQAPSGAGIAYAYGPDGVVKRVHYTGAPGLAGLPDLQCINDGLGRPVRLVQGDVILDRAYDRHGRLTSETISGHTARWTYDDVLGVADLAFPDGRIDRYQFDALGRLSAITLHEPAGDPLTGPTLTAGSLLARYEYGGLTRVMLRVLGNGCQTLYTYDRGRRLSGIDHRDAGGSTLALLEYVYDAMGRRRVMRVQPMSGQSAMNDFDQLSRLRRVSQVTTAPEPPRDAVQEEADAYVRDLGAIARQTHDYVLDLADGRRRVTLTEATGTAVETYATNSLHQITGLTRSVNGTTSVHPFTYDRDGHRTKDDRFIYAYDVLGRLIDVREAGSGGTLLRQTYDPAGRIMSRTSARTPAVEHLRFLGDRLLQHETSTGAPVRQQCLGLDANELIAQSSGRDQWCHQDACLSLIALSDNSGSPIERYTYTPFGAPAIWNASGTMQRIGSGFAMPPVFGGHRSLSLNGLYDARARVYDAHTGNFIQRDSRGYIDSPNPYVYALHNPVDLVDPTGELAPILAILAVIAVGAAIGAGFSAVRQGIQLAEGSRTDFSWGEVGIGALWGGGGALVCLVAPEAAVVFAGFGVISGIDELSQGHYATGAFDIGTALIPFTSRRVRVATFGRGTLFGQRSGLGRAENFGERIDHVYEIDRQLRLRYSWSRRRYPVGERQRFRELMQSRILSGPRNPMEFTIDPQTLRFRRPHSLAHADLADESSVIQAAHLESDWMRNELGHEHRLAIGDAFENQSQNNTIEQIGNAVIELPAIEVGPSRIPVVLSSAMLWERNGLLAPGTVDGSSPSRGWSPSHLRPLSWRHPDITTIPLIMGGVSGTLNITGK